MDDSKRPDPDVVLAGIRSEERARHQGRLKIFLGMVAGVGKTCAMLETAHRKKKEGKDVVVALVETHDRKYTAKLLEGLEVLPRLQGSGMAPGGELDLEGVLARRPEIVVVDELPHTNPRGFRHQKRYQDIEEILEAGIDVYTAMNVQHFESRSSVASKLSGVPIRETVPDSILDRASEIELIDLTPEELLERLQGGQIYGAEKIQQALQGFFKRGTLTALREMSLRIAAEKVDHEIQGLIHKSELPKLTRNRSRLMVAIGPSPSGAELLRWTRQKAYNLEAPWIALYVDSGRELTAREQAWLDSNLNLARELGAEIVTASGFDISGVLLETARAKNVSDIVLGRPVRNLWTRLFRARSPVDRLFREASGIDILLVDTQKTVSPTLGQLLASRVHSRLPDYGLALASVGVALLLNSFLVVSFSYQVTGLVFLSTILLQSLYTGRGPVLLSAILSALAWNFFFTDPKWSFKITSFEDKLLLALYFFAAVVTGTLATRLKQQREGFRRRDERSNNLLLFAKTFSEHSRLSELWPVLVAQLGRELRGEAVLFLTKDAGLEIFGEAPWIPDSKDRAVADWAMQKLRRAGKGTETLPEASGIFYPLVLGGRARGVIAFRLQVSRPLSVDEKTLFEFVVNLLETFVAREDSLAALAYASALEESEKLHRSLLNSISHEIKTPLTAIGGAALAIGQERMAQDTETRRQLSDELLKAWTRLRHLVDNLLDMSRLESGFLKPTRDWVNVAEIFEVVLRDLPESEDSRRLIVEVDEKLPLLRSDFGLIEVAVKNLLLNALRYGAGKEPVELRAGLELGVPYIEVLDHGPGIPAEAQDRIFEKFYRVPGSKPGGMGLGLSIAKGFVEVLGGSVSLVSRPGETRVRLNFPGVETLADPGDDA
jgi:two-component system sensor histidine kinase KdpD